MDDESLRESVRQNLRTWLDKLQCGGDVELKMSYKRKLISKLRKSPVAINTEDANEQHYEVPTEFFLECLGKRMKYSSALWPDGVKTLDESEDRMLALVCERAQVEDAQKVLDLGCGWGVTGLWILEKYPNCTVFCVSNSRTQKQFIESQAKRKGFADRLTCITADANLFDTNERFDRIISIEMFEHMKNYEVLMRQVAKWLKPGGLLFTQILCHREFAYEFKSNRGSDTEWMAKQFFSGGTMPSSDFFLYFQNDLMILDHWNINGKHYSKTLEAWLRKLDQNKGNAMKVLEKAYGKDAAPQHMFNWRMFFMYCSEVFNFDNGNEWIVAHHLFMKRPKALL
ncbi:uncharacterized protein LOC135680867 [Rhopilema esculentum]|uniref:uncharacterized protein LOC135680867 n=1 Tax=Rhopilema esculentum TaxID=499914 RepID=UPI0031E3E209|eukprot:gene13065-3843_t